MTRSPRVTVGFTTYNVERFLPEAFDSILAQDFEDYEILVCDNGSTDSTLQICEDYAAKYSQFRVYRNPSNLGVSGSYNRAVGLARGEFYMAAMHDDVCAPTFITQCLRALDDLGPDAVLAFPAAAYMDERRALLGSPADDVELRERAPWRRVFHYASSWNLVCEFNGVIRIDALRRTGLLQPILSSDVKMLHELAALGTFVKVPDVLFFSRIHSKSTYQGGMTPAAVLALLEPTASHAEHRRLRRAKTHHSGISAKIVRGLLAMDLPAATRVSCTSAYLCARAVRTVRVRVGRWRRRFAGVPKPQAPFEARPSVDRQSATPHG